MNCPGCNHEILNYSGRSGATRYGALQHHFSLGHGIEVIRSHELARLADKGKLTKSDIAELKQLPLPIGAK